MVKERLKNPTLLFIKTNDESGILNNNGYPNNII
jgi:hypothetical protein